MGISDVCLLAKVPKQQNSKSPLHKTLYKPIYNITKKYNESTIARF